VNGLLYKALNGL